MSDPYYNEGVGHGGFVATYTTAGSVVMESFNRDRPSSHVINVPTAIGAPSKWAGVSGFETASGTAQLPVTAGTVTLIGLGDDFTAPSTHGGGSWVVINVGAAFQMGDYWKAAVTLQKKYN